MEQALAEGAERGLTKKIYTTGNNVVAEQIDSIKDGTCIYSGAGNPGLFPACEVAIAIANGTADKYPKEMEIPFYPITPDNVGEYYDLMKSNPDIYMLGNLPPSQNPCYQDLAQRGFPEFVELIHDMPSK